MLGWPEVPNLLKFLPFLLAQSEDIRDCLGPWVRVLDLFNCFVGPDLVVPGPGDGMQLGVDPGSILLSGFADGMFAKGGGGWDGFGPCVGNYHVIYL